MKQRPRALRDWPNPHTLDRDYATGRDLTGTWHALPSTEPRERHNAPLPGGPQLLVNQWDKALTPQE